MVDIKTAVANSMEFAKASLGPERTMGLRLEEVESSNLDGTAVWLITLSNIEPLPEGVLATGLKNSAFFQTVGADAGREYKTFTVAKDSGEVLSMRIRLLAVPS